MRREGWEDRLVAEIEAAKERAWAWGEHDCCAFARRCAQACGSAQFDGFRWDSRDTASAVLDAGGGLMDILDALGERIPVRMAGRGDVVAITSEDGPAGMTLGVVEGGVAWCAALRGVERAPLSAAFAAWRVA